MRLLASSFYIPHVADIDSIAARSRFLLPGVNRNPRGHTHLPYSHHGVVSAATGGPPPEEVFQGDHGRHGFRCPQVSPMQTVEKGIPPKKKKRRSLTLSSSTWISLAGSLGLVMPSGGSVSFVYGFVFCIVCNICLSASVGELASLWPTAGGQYHYAYAMATKKWKKSMVRFSPIHPFTDHAIAHLTPPSPPELPCGMDQHRRLADPEHHSSILWR